MRRKLQEYFAQWQVQNISFDSRKVKEGDAFFAIRGEDFNGNEYIEQVLQAGASVVFTDNPLLKKDKVIYLEDIRLQLALAAGMFCPKTPPNLLAVTGTNGKSSVVSYINQILYLLGKKSASIGTIGIESNVDLSKKLNDLYPQSLTTPDPITLRRILQDLANEKIEYVAFEASSHGLAQNRLGDIKVKAAGFTSFSQDHLEYHKTLDGYLHAKLALFSEHLDVGGQVVINADMACLDLVKNALNQQGVDYTTVGSNGDMAITIDKQDVSGQNITYRHGNKKYQFRTNIVGSFQATNILIAAKMVASLGIDFDQVSEVLSSIVAVPGRLQRITNSTSSFQVFVDYAHTPDALEKSLTELKKIKLNSGKLYVVFGCGGNRDASKRAIMGKIAVNIADIVVITDDNPRNEDPDLIRAEIMTGIKSKVYNISGRREAIKHAMAKLKKDDILLVAGKGHENYQIIGSHKSYFSDAETIQNILDQKE